MAPSGQAASLLGHTMLYGPSLGAPRKGDWFVSSPYSITDQSVFPSTDCSPPLMLVINPSVFPLLEYKVVLQILSPAPAIGTGL